MIQQSSTPDHGWCGNPARGASMGRESIHIDPDEPQQAELVRVYVNSQGYDPGGSYWGTGAPLFELATEDGSQFFRAYDREDAVAYVAENWPEVTILSEPTLDRTLPVDDDIDVTDAVVHCNALSLSIEQQRAVRRWAVDFGLATEGEAASWPGNACESLLHDWVTGCDDDDPRIWRSDDGGRVYFYAGQ